jgi:hypothetical protein
MFLSTSPLWAVSYQRFSPKTYYFNSNNKYQFKLDTFMHYGFIAQELKRIVPCMVHTVVTPPQVDTGGHITVPASTIEALDYGQFAPILTEAMQEQQQTIDSLRNALQGIQNCLSQLCANGGRVQYRHNDSTGSTTTTNVQDVTLSGLADTPLLFQNDPNPYSGNTSIRYYLPTGAHAAEMMFFDSYGKQMKVVELNQTGNGVLNVTSDNLTAGIYAYSLVVGGTVMDTKRMILQK